MGDDQRFTRRNVLATGAAATAALAGCTSGNEPDADAEGQDEPESETATPTSTPAAPTLEEFQYPDGASQDGVDREALASTHRSAIIDAGSHTLEMDRTETFGGQSQSSEITKKWASAGVSVVTDGQLTETLWSPSDERAGYVQMDTGFEQRYRIDNVAPTAEEVSDVSRFEQLVGGVVWSEATEVVEDAAGDYAVVYEAMGVGDEETLSRLIYGEVTDLQATIAVSEAGHVSELSYDITVEQEHGSIGEKVDATVTAVGETELEEPSWLETAQNEGAQFEMRLTENDEVIELEMVNGTEIPSDAGVSASSGGKFGSTQVPEAISIGDRLNVAVVGDDELAVAVNESPSETAPLGGFVRATLRFDQYTLFEEEIHP